jgi:hypothetical protein
VPDLVLGWFRQQWLLQQRGDYFWLFAAVFHALFCF